MSHSTPLDKEPTATLTPGNQAGVRVVRRHHVLVRCSHWLNVPILLGLILSGVSIYWASPVYQHQPDPVTGSLDLLAEVGISICAHVPGLHQYSSPPDWIFNHISLGLGMLAVALRLHWLCAYLFMLNGLVFVVSHGRWLALSVASPDRPARCTEDLSLLHGPSHCETNVPHLAVSALQDKIQPRLSVLLRQAVKVDRLPIND